MTGPTTPPIAADEGGRVTTSPPAAPGPVPADRDAPVDLGPDAERNVQVLARALGAGPVRVHLPAGTFAVSGNICLGTGQQLLGCRDDEGRPGTRLQAHSTTGEPFIRIVGSGAAVDNVAMAVPARAAGEHEGDLGTAVTVGRYLYAEIPAWIREVRLSNLGVERPGRARPVGGAVANSVAIMGAVQDVVVDGLDVRGGGTGLAVHWGARASSVRDIEGPSYHPHHIAVRGLRVSSAFEGFYLSSVHDVLVTGADLESVEIGFRLLPGDNTARFAPTEPPTPVSSRIEISDCRVAWSGDLYAVRAAGWGQSLVDAVVTRLPFESTVIRRCTLRSAGRGPERRAAIVLEHADGLVLEDITFDPGEVGTLIRTDGAARARLTALTVG